MCQEIVGGKSGLYVWEMLVVIIKILTLDWNEGQTGSDPEEGKTAKHNCLCSPEFIWMLNIG